MKLSPPIENFSWSKNVSQFFGVGKFVYEPRFGIPGHNAIDIVVNDKRNGFGEKIFAAHDGIVEKIHYDFPHRTNGNGIYIVSSDGSFSTNYWHLSSFLVSVGEKVKAGQVIGTMGNSGFVLPPPSNSCPTCGTHLHFGVLCHSKKTNPYSGFVDPTPLLFKEGERFKFRFDQTIVPGSEGDEVSWLQTVLKIEGFSEDYEPIGYCGSKTVRDIMKLQSKYGLTPFPALGPKTRKILNDKYAI